MAKFTKKHWDNNNKIIGFGLGVLTKYCNIVILENNLFDGWERRVGINYIRVVFFK